MQHYSNADWALVLLIISAVFITLAWIFLKPTLSKELNPKEREKQKMIKDLSVLLRQVGRTLNFYRATKSLKLQESYERIALQQFYLAHTIQYLKNQAHGIYRYPSYEEIIEDYPAGIGALEDCNPNLGNIIPLGKNYWNTYKDGKRYYPNVDDDRNPIFEKDNLDPAIDWSQEREIERTLEKNNSQPLDNEDMTGITNTRDWCQETIDAQKKSTERIELPGKFPNGRDCIVTLNDNSEQRPSSAIPKFPEDRIGKH